MVWIADTDIDSAVTVSACAAVANVATVLANFASNASTRSVSRCVCRRFIASSAALAAESSSLCSIASLKTCTASAIAPISSPRSRPKISTAVSCSASRRMMPAIRLMGRATPVTSHMPVITQIIVAPQIVIMTHSRAELYAAEPAFVAA